MVGRIEHEIRRVGRVVAQEHDSLPPRDRITSEQDRQRGHRDRDHHRDVERERTGRHRDTLRRHETPDTEHTKDVEDVAANHVADRDVALPADRCQHRGGHFWQRRAGGHNRQADHQLADTEAGGDGHGGIDQPLRTEHEQPQPNDDEADVQQRPRPARRLAECLLVLAPHVGRLPPAQPNQEHGVGDHRDAQQQPVQASDPAVEGEYEHQHRRGNHHRDVEPYQLLRDHQRHDQCRDAENEQHVEDAAADDVADRHVGLPGVRRPDCHGQFRGTGAERHDRQADHQRRDARHCSEA